MNVQMNIGEATLIECLILEFGKIDLLYEIAKASEHIDPEGFAHAAYKLLKSGCPADEDI